VDLSGAALRYVTENQARLLSAAGVHLQLSATALLIAIALFVPLGVLAARSSRVGPAVVGMVSAVRVVPSLAVLFLLLPVLGTGFAPALVALTLLAGPPLIVNTDAGLRGVDPSALESGRGLGMSRRQLFRQVELPLALPMMVAGVRAAAVEVIASATLAAFIGAGGLGTFILAGLTLVDFRLLLVGAIPVTMMALATEIALSRVEHLVTPPAAWSAVSSATARR
jgi:osmoprotectant transport system permease protein